MSKKKKVLLAVGGTGGHLFPAQALAYELQESGQVEVAFGGGKLATNPFFQKAAFTFFEVESATPFRKRPFSAILPLIRGSKKSCQILHTFRPDLVIGFGSFYSFPLLVSAFLKRIPYLLVETNTVAGKVNRLFARGAKATLVQFPDVVCKGNVEMAKMPIFSKRYSSSVLDAKEARKSFGLDPEEFTLLIFGGSDGANAINQETLRLDCGKVQVLHFCGKTQNIEELKDSYKKKGILAYVKPFEEKIYLALQAADLAVARAGAGTLTELIETKTPSILIPWPKALENHQQKNAAFLEKIGGAFVLQEQNLKALSPYIKRAKENLSVMQNHLAQYHKQYEKNLTQIVLTYLEECL